MNKNIVIASRPRTITIILFVLVIYVVGYTIVASILHMPTGRSYFAEGRRAYNAYDLIFTSLLFFLEVYLIWYFIWRYTFVVIDVPEQQLKVSRPFQFYRQTYQFSDVTGFYLTSRYNKWCEIKVMVLLLANGDKVKITDFETGNFRKIEAAAWEQFPFVDVKTKVPLTKSQKESYRFTTNKKFDLEQAKAIRFSTIIILICFILIALFESGLVFNTYSNQLPAVVKIGALLFTVYLVTKLLKVRKLIHKLDE